MTTQLTIYPSHCHVLSLTLGKWCPLRIVDVLNLKEVEGFEGSVFSRLPFALLFHSSCSGLPHPFPSSLGLHALRNLYTLLVPMAMNYKSEIMVNSLSI
jgi:hypothetical protein